MMPTFARGAEVSPVFVHLLARHLRHFGVELPTAGEGAYRQYSGDLSVSDKGEILVWQPAI
jgi:hypothetical protein